jgi:hypothetical protein
VAVAIEVWETERRRGRWARRGSRCAAAPRPRLFTGCFASVGVEGGLFPIFGGGSGSGRWKPNYPNVQVIVERTLWFGEIAQRGRRCFMSSVICGAGAHRKCAGFGSLVWSTRNRNDMHFVQF